MPQDLQGTLTDLIEIQNFYFKKGEFTKVRMVCDQISFMITKYQKKTGQYDPKAKMIICAREGI